MRCHKAKPPNDPEPAQGVGPDQAWKMLTLVVDWIKHAESKAGATLAVTGVAGTVLYNLVKNWSDPSLAESILAGACGLLLFLSGAACAWGLRPRIRSNEDPTSLLFYSHISRTYSLSQGPEAFVSKVTTMQDEGRLTSEILAQVWSNAHVASAKFKWINYGLTCLLMALVMLAATASLAACR